MSVDTTNWNAIEFTVDGVEFLSILSDESPFLPRISMVGLDRFIQLNQEAIRDLVGQNLAIMSRYEIKEKLNVINLGAQHAIVELA